MTTSWKFLAWILVIGSLESAGWAQTPATVPTKRLPLHLADYDAEPRLPNGRVDIEKLAARLQELGLTTYYFLVLHAATDWEDLKLFLPVAARNHLAVWVYLVPPSESPPLVGNLYSEPFRLNYLRWAEEIAKLSLQHTNLTGWVIDDFFVNHQLFTPAYVRAMQQRARKISPQLHFLPLMYFNELGGSFAEDYHEVIDGVVVAYPRDRLEIDMAWEELNDAPVARRAEFTFPDYTTSSPGDYISASQRGHTTSKGLRVIRFREREDYTGPTSGYHFKQLLLNGKVAWEEDVAGGTNGWREIKIELPPIADENPNVEVTFRLLDKQGVGNFGVRWELAQLRTEGLKLEASLAEPEQWQLKRHGSFKGGFGGDLTRAGGRWHVPFVVMTAGQEIEFRLRHGEPASPERRAEWLRMCMRALREGKCDGVVTYCLDKEPGSRVFDLSRKVFEEGR